VDVAPQAKTISDLIRESDAYWKGVKKELAAEKERMQKMAEGLSDLNVVEAELARLPARHEAEASKAQLTSEIENLQNQVQLDMILRERQSNHRKRIDQCREALSALGANRKQQATDAATALANVEAVFLELMDKFNKVNAALQVAEERQRNFSLLRARLNLRTGESAQASEHRETIAQAVAELNALANCEPTFQEKLANAEKALKDAEAQAAAPAKVEVRTDDFKTHAQPGKSYLVTATAVHMGDGSAPQILEVKSWAEEKPAIDDEDAANIAYELQQEIQEKAEAVEIARTHIAELRQNRETWSVILDAAKAQLAKAEAAQNELADLQHQLSGSDQVATEVANLRAELVTLNQKINAERINLAGHRQTHQVESAAWNRVLSLEDELSRLLADSPEPAMADSELEALKSELGNKKASIPKIENTILEIVRLAQDRKRIDEAALKRSEVEADLKVLGTVIDTLAEKKTEIVSGSIEGPLAIANKLGADILRGPLVFEEEEIGMRVGNRFISSRTFSGTESAIVMMGLTAGLAAGSKLRVLMLDEFGLVDTDNAAQLLRNLDRMLKDRDIDQFLVFGPTNPALLSVIDPAINVIEPAVAQ
jgi:hypothetical protein